MQFDQLTTIELADKALMHFKDHEQTFMYWPFNAIGLTDEDFETGKYNGLIYDAIQALNDSLGYIEKIGNSGQWYLLTDKGREVKAAGGHFAYIDKLATKAKTDEERQQLSDEKLHAELDIVKFQKGLGKKFTIWAFIVSIIAIIASVLTTVATTHKEDKPLQIDTVFLKQQLQKLDLRIQKLEQQKHKDTIPKY